MYSLPSVMQIEKVQEHLSRAIAAYTLNGVVSGMYTCSHQLARHVHDSVMCIYHGLVPDITQ